MLLAGERRFNACKSLKHERIDAIIVGNKFTTILGLVENVQRLDLSAIDEAQWLAALKKEGKFARRQSR